MGNVTLGGGGQGGNCIRCIDCDAQVSGQPPGALVKKAVKLTSRAIKKKTLAEDLSILKVSMCSNY